MSGLRREFSVPLYRNAYALMLNTVVNSGLGLVYWIAAAHAFGAAAVMFVVSTAVWSIFNLQDAALTGLRAAVWVPLENGTYGLVKLVLLIIVAQTSLADGVFTSWSSPVIALLVPVNLLIFRRVLSRYAAADEELQAAAMIGATVLLAPTLGLLAVGWAVLAAELVPALILAVPVARWLRGPRGAAAG